MSMMTGHGAGEAGAEVVHEEQGGLLHTAALPLAPLHHHRSGVEVLLLLPAARNNQN